MNRSSIYRYAEKTIFVFLCVLILVESAFGKNERVAEVPPTFFGLHVHRMTEIGAWPAGHGGAFRAWDAYVSWRDIQPTRGRWDFSRLDKLVEICEKSNVSVLLVLGSTPAWASMRPDEPCAYGRGCAAPPLLMDDWRAYIKALGSRYRGRIQGYQIWNEFNLKEFYSGSNEQMLALHKAAFEELREVDPDALVVSPSITGASQSELGKFGSYLRLGAGEYSDVLSYHFYTPLHQPEAVIPVIKELKKAAKSSSAHELPLWNTETGWVVLRKGEADSSSINPKWLRLSPERAAAYMARSFILAAANDVDRYYWYAYDNRFIGSFKKSESGAGDVMATAFALTKRWLEGLRPGGCREEEGAIYNCTFTKADGTAVSFVWASGEHSRVWQTPHRTDRVEGISGAMKLSENGSVPLGEFPLRVESQ